MTALQLQFDAVSEDQPGPRWQSRWQRSWPAYRHWFIARGGERGPSRAASEQALQDHMSELLPVWRRLVRLTGDDDLAARFLSTWCPPAYLGGCSLAALSRNGHTRLVRNYDLSPELNEGLLLRTAWTGTPVMGMVEFLWGLSDGINAHGLSVALAYGGHSETARGFGVTTIVRYLLETCRTVADALAVLQRVPSHMAYNLSLADRSGMTLSVELLPGGGLRVMPDAIATNHQHGGTPPTRPAFTRTIERRDHLATLLGTPIEADHLAAEFLRTPLFQENYTGGLGTLFTAEYDPQRGSLVLWWPDGQWRQQLDAFAEGTRLVRYSMTTVDASSGWQATPSWLDSLQVLASQVSDRNRFDRWLLEARQGQPDWAAFGHIFTPSQGGNSNH